MPIPAERRPYRGLLKITVSVLGETVPVHGSSPHGIVLPFRKPPSESAGMKYASSPGFPAAVPACRLTPTYPENPGIFRQKKTAGIGGANQAFFLLLH